MTMDGYSAEKQVEKLQRESKLKDKVIECLQGRIARLQHRFRKPTRKRKR